MLYASKEIQYFLSPRIMSWFNQELTQKKSSPFALQSNFPDQAIHLPTPFLAL